ncbi:MAG: hypothetical protein JXM73_06505 [Anaerolineae bacterium]|nr:hypothetical protein [Anaerolineae bacterium]
MSELELPYSIQQLRGPVADPAITMLLRKDLLAQIKFRALQMEMQQLEQQVAIVKLQMDMLAKEYKIR